MTDPVLKTESNATWELTPAEQRLVRKFREAGPRPVPWSHCYSEEYRLSVVDYCMEHTYRQARERYGHSNSTILAWKRKFYGRKV